MGNIDQVTPSSQQDPLPTAIPVPLPNPSPSNERRLRLWPGIVIVLLQWPLIVVPGWIAPGTMMHFMSMFLVPMIAGAAVACWWLFASRLRWLDRVLILLICAVGAAAAYFLSHPSFGFFGIAIYMLPWVTTAWVAWLVVSLRLRWSVRRAGIVCIFVVGWAYATTLRLEGVDGSMSATLDYRWAPTAEEKFLAEIAGKGKSAAELSSANAKPMVLQAGDWPGFRGPNRDGRLAGVRIATDWQQHPPRQVWRHRIGPGWGSFSVVGNYLYTQEQRGADEIVACYDADTGSEIWIHRDSARFSETVSGAGPRATPTFYEGKIYALGAGDSIAQTGMLNCLDAATGAVKWTRDIVSDSGAKVPTWGFSASPLVAQGVVTVFAGGPDHKSVLGYDPTSGKLLWSAGEGQLSYSSLQLSRVDGVEQLLIVTDAGLTAFAPTSGEVLWQHPWPIQDIARIVQPALLSDSDVLIGTGMGIGTRRVHVKHESKNWTAEEVWTTLAIKPYFNDLVIHKGHLYGFDGAFFTCVALEDGKGKWRQRGYGNGQVLLLTDQDVLLVLSEKGDVAIIEADPARCKELGRFKAIEGKTWNHPVLAHGKLFVRNGEEAACFQLDEQRPERTARK
jgi:outer membrane protein assembly factor BamB